MATNSSGHMIYMTAGTPEEAQSIAKTLIKEHLIACANIIEGVTSIYSWRGQVETEIECVVVMKTTSTRVEAALVRIKELHSYDAPCAVSYEMSDGLPDYLDWLMSETRGI